MFEHDGTAVLTCPHNRQVEINVHLREYRDAWGMGSWSGEATASNGQGLFHTMDCNHRLTIKVPGWSPPPL